MRAVSKVDHGSERETTDTSKIQSKYYAKISSKAMRYFHKLSLKSLEASFNISSAINGWHMSSTVHNHQKQK